MTEDNVMEFCQWLVSEKGIEAGNLSDYINNNEEEVLKLAQEFKKPKFKVGGKVEAAAEMFKCGGKSNKIEKAKDGDKISRKEYKEKKKKRSEVKKSAKQNFGFNNAQFQTAYENAKYGFSNQGLSRRDAKLAAQRALMGNMNPQSNNSLPQIKANHTIDIDRGLLNRVAEGPRKVFILPVDPVVTNSDYKINTNIDWDNIGNDLEIVTTLPDHGDTIFSGGNIDDVVVVAQKPDAKQRTNGDNIVEFVKNIRFVTPKINLPRFNADLHNLPRMESTRSIVPFLGYRDKFQNGGLVNFNSRIIKTPKEEAELVVNNGDSIIYRNTIPRNGSFTYVKENGNKN